MSEHPFDDLDRIGSATTPRIDTGFADRLEAELRVQHAQRAPARSFFPKPRTLSVGLAAAAVVVLGWFGLGQLQASDPGVPLEVLGQPSDPSDADRRLIDDEATGDGDLTGDTPAEPGDAVGENADTIIAQGDDSSEAIFMPTPTPTSASDAFGGAVPTASGATPSGGDAATDTPASGGDTAPTVVVDSATPVSTAVTDATAGPTDPTPSPTRPTVTPEPTRPPRPTASPEPLSTATPVPAPSATPLPTSTPEPAIIDASCELRTNADVRAVLCEWQPPVGVDLTAYALHRTRNGAPRELVTTTQAFRHQAIDRDVESGDRLIYVVTGLNADRIQALSNRLTVQIPQ